MQRSYTSCNLYQSSGSFEGKFIDEHDGGVLVTCRGRNKRLDQVFIVDGEIGRSVEKHISIQQQAPGRKITPQPCSFLAVFLASTLVFALKLTLSLVGMLWALLAGSEYSRA